MNIQKVKAAIFDLDGTLLNTLADIGAGANTALRRFGYPTYSVEAYQEKIGHGVRNLIRRAMPQDATDEQYEEVLAFYLSYYPQHCTEKTDYFPGVKEFLDHLVAQNIKIAVISNKTEPTAQKVIKHYFPDYPWEFVWGRTDSRPLKPAPEAGILACETLGLKPEEIIYIGDGDSDMELASKMGFIAAGVTWGYRSAEQLIAAGADFLSGSFEELKKNAGL